MFKWFLAFALFIWVNIGTAEAFDYGRFINKPSRIIETRAANTIVINQLVFEKKSWSEDNSSSFVIRLNLQSGKHKVHCRFHLNQTHVTDQDASRHFDAILSMPRNKKGKTKKPEWEQYCEKNIVIEQVQLHALHKNLIGIDIAFSNKEHYKAVIHQGRFFPKQLLSSHVHSAIAPDFNLSVLPDSAFSRFSNIVVWGQPTVINNSTQPPIEDIILSAARNIQASEGRYDSLISLTDKALRNVCLVRIKNGSIHDNGNLLRFDGNWTSSDPKCAELIDAIKGVSFYALSTEQLGAEVKFKDNSWFRATFPHLRGAKLRPSQTNNDAQYAHLFEQRELDEQSDMVKIISSAENQPTSNERLVPDFSAANVRKGFEHLRDYCQGLNPEDAESLYKCMQHYKYNDHPKSSSLFSTSLPKSSCQSTRRELRRALKEAGFSKEFINPKLPNCAQLAPVAKRIRWKTGWVNCLDYQPDDERYNAECFGQFIYSQYSPNTALSNMEKTHCSTLVLQYEKAVKGGQENNQLPDNFVPLTCNDIKYLKPAVRQRLSERVACGNVTGYVSEQGVYNCLAAAQVKMDGMDCPALKVAYREVLTSLHGTLDSLLFPKDCDQLLNIALVNSDSYKKQQQLAKRKADLAEAARITAAHEKAEREDKELAEYVKNLPRTLDSLAIAVERDRRSGAKRFSSRSFIWRMRARIELLNDVADELKALMSSQTDRRLLKEIALRYRYSDDWSSKLTDASILKTFEQVRGSLDPFKGLAMAEYLNSIYWVDIDHLIELDSSAYGSIKGYAKGVVDQAYDSLNLFNKLFPVVDKQILADEKKILQTPSLLKVAINTYLTNYQRLSAACIGPDYITHEYYRAATPDIVTVDEYGAVISQEYGTPEERRTYKIHKKFRKVARRLDIDERTEDDSAASIAVLRKLAPNLATQARQIKDSHNDISRGVIEIMKNYRCDSELIIEFEDGMLNAFSAYF